MQHIDLVPIAWADASPHELAVEVCLRVCVCVCVCVGFLCQQLGPHMGWQHDVHASRMRVAGAAVAIEHILLKLAQCFSHGGCKGAGILAFRVSREASMFCPATLVEGVYANLQLP